MISEKIPTYKKVWSLLNESQRRGSAVLIFLMLIGMTLETLGVGLVIPTLLLLTQSDISKSYPDIEPFLSFLGNPSQRILVIMGMLTLVFAYFIKTLFLGLLAWWQMRFAFGVQAQLSQRLFTTYLQQPYTFHLQRNSAQLIRNVINEVSMITGNALLPVMMLITESLVLLGLFGLLFVVEPQGAMVVLSVLGTAAWSFHLLTHGRVGSWGLARQHHEGLRLQSLQQGLGGVKDVKVFGREQYFLEQYRIHNFQSARAAQFQSTLQQLPRLWLELLAISGLALLVISMMWQGRALEHVLPTLGLFAAAAFRLLPSVNRILSSLQALRYGVPVIDTLFNELSLVSPKHHEAQTNVLPLKEAIELSAVTFSYPGSVKPTLQDVSLVVHRGETVGFLGSSGAGKSTLVDIILGLLSPDRGWVRADGRSIHTGNVRHWQCQIGYVPQSIYLTDDTLRRNVAFGIPDHQINEQAVERAINAAQLQGFVSSLPNGINTFVGERGVRLSGGQRQRIGIARALYNDPEVLVLDEATSSLDSTTERGIIDAVVALHGKKTILIVAHRLTTLENCDRLFRIENGHLVAIHNNTI